MAKQTFTNSSSPKTPKVKKAGVVIIYQDCYQCPRFTQKKLAGWCLRFKEIRPADGYQCIPVKCPHAPFKKSSTGEVSGH